MTNTEGDDEMMSLSTVLNCDVLEISLLMRCNDFSDQCSFSCFSTSVMFSNYLFIKLMNLIN